MEHFSTIFLSGLVPFLSVWVAQKLSVRHQWKQDLRNELARTSHNSIEALLALKDLYTSTSDATKKQDTRDYQRLDRGITLLESNLLSIQLLASRETRTLCGLLDNLIRTLQASRSQPQDEDLVETVEVLELDTGREIHATWRRIDRAWRF